MRKCCVLVVISGCWPQTRSKSCGYLRFLSVVYYTVKLIYIVLYCVFILSAISPYTTGLKGLFNQSDCTGTAQTQSN